MTTSELDQTRVTLEDSFGALHSYLETLRLAAAGAFQHDSGVDCACDIVVGHARAEGIKAQEVADDLMIVAGDLEIVNAQLDEERWTPEEIAQHRLRAFEDAIEAIRSSGAPISHHNSGIGAIKKLILADEREQASLAAGSVDIGEKGE